MRFGHQRTSKIRKQMLAENVGLSNMPKGDSIHRML
jgi:hypothetical protein